VGLSVTALALRASVGSVITAGIDFAYTIDAYHARATPGHREISNRQNRFKSVINSAAGLKDGSFQAKSKSGGHVRSDPVMRNYRELFCQEFSGESRLFDITGAGLFLGVKTVSPEEAFAILNGNNESSAAIQADCFSNSKAKFSSSKIIEYIQEEIKNLNFLREILTGAVPIEEEKLKELIFCLDYLWAHFPEYAGSGVKIQALTESFLKRVRVEIEPFLKLMDMTLEELNSHHQRRRLECGL
jgi:hypothetical protein